MSEKISGKHIGGNTWIIILDGDQLLVECNERVIAAMPATSETVAALTYNKQAVTDMVVAAVNTALYYSRFWGQSRA